MRIILIFLVYIFTLNFSFADTSKETLDSSLDYTLIDCVDWSDSNWEVFNSTKPFQSLKAWIESTVNYVNSNYNKPWNEELANNRLFKIKVNCTMKNIISSDIQINFNWLAYNNFLLIEWVNPNSFLIDGIYFSSLKLNDTNTTFFSNVEIKNAKFLNTNINSNYYFNNISSVKITNSYISLKDKQNLWYYWYNTYYNNKYYYYVNNISIENSIIDIKINSDYQFSMPAIVRDSKISFHSDSPGHKINFFQADYLSVFRNIFINRAIMFSNEMDLGWNIFSTTNSIDSVFLNNKFINFSDFLFWSDLGKPSYAVFVNNFFDNNQKLNISSYSNLYNNIFKSWFTSTYDIFNLRRNFQEWEQWSWLGWVFNIWNAHKFLSFNMDNFKLFEYLKWEKITKDKNGIYIIYN